MIIKVLIILGVLALTVVIFRGRGTPSQLAIRRLGAVVLAVLGGVAVIWPQWVTWFANRIGVGRGTDLVLYVLVVVFLWVTASSYRRIADLERRYVELARQLAIHESFSTRSGYTTQAADRSEKDGPYDSSLTS